ncbi:MAG: DUF3696 domain-containing protein [Polyangiaceae bacterium]|nr:DUF3696 domain-containing protein [Polyangiaceae bacterium]
MFTAMRLKSFKGWEDTGDVRLAPITLFFGSNSSGKTSLLQAILLLKQTAASSDRSRVLYPGDDRSLVDLGTVPDLIHGHAADGALEVGLNWTSSPGDPALPVEDGEANLGFATRVRLTPEGQPHVESIFYGIGDVSVNMAESDSGGYKLVATGIPLKRKRGRPWPLPAPVRFYGFPSEVENYYRDAQWLSDLVLVLEKQFDRVQYVGPLREYPKRTYLWAGEKPENVGKKGELAVAALLAARAEERKIPYGEGRGRRWRPFEEVIAGWLREMGAIDSFEVVAIARNRKDYEVRVKRTPESSEVLITDVGFGISQLLPVLVQSYYATPHSTVIFEQPEIHLHPRLQAAMADVIIDAMKRCDVQFIIESHSEHFLRRLQRRIAEEVLTKDDVALYRCDVDGGKSTIDQLTVDSYGNITNWPKDFFGDEMGDLAAMTRAGIRRRRQG